MIPVREAIGMRANDRQVIRLPAWKRRLAPQYIATCCFTSALYIS
jgi:hypothetical protein